jgi:hypothetical protein
VSNRLFHRLYRPDVHAGPALRIIGAAGGCALVALLASGCAGATAAPAASSSASPKPSAGASAYLTCLRQHGVTVPTARPTARPSGGFTASPAMQKAKQACASLRPAGGFGGFGGGQFAAAFQAFRSCMAAQGEPIPATRPTAPPATPPSPGADRFLNGLNPSTPKVAAALKACQSKLPRFPARTPSRRPAEGGPGAARRQPAGSRSAR